MPQFSFRACLLAGVLALLPALAIAKSYTIPDPNPVAVVTIPDDWDVTEIRRGVEAESDDEEVYIAIEVADLTNFEQAARDTVAWLKSKGVEADESTVQQKPITINGMEGFDVSWSGKDEDGPTQISLTMLQVNATKGLIVTYWATPKGEKDNHDALVSIITSLKPVR